MSLSDLVALLPNPRPRRRSSAVPRKLTADVALAISRDPSSLSRIAKRHGLAKSTVSRIKRGLLWGDAIRALTDEEMERVRCG